MFPDVSSYSTVLEFCLVDTVERRMDNLSAYSLMNYYAYKYISLTESILLKWLFAWLFDFLSMPICVVYLGLPLSGIPTMRKRMTHIDDDPRIMGLVIKI